MKLHNFLFRFEIRYRNNWEKADTFYDAWLIQTGKQREVFDFDLDDIASQEEESFLPSISSTSRRNIAAVSIKEEVHFLPTRKVEEVITISDDDETLSVSSPITTPVTIKEEVYFPANKIEKVIVISDDDDDSDNDDGDN